MRFLLPVVAVFFLSLSCVIKQDSRVYLLEKRLMEGDKSALFEIAPYFDSKKKIIEYLGYHILETNESHVAKRIVEENCIFTDDEINVREATGKVFLDFLKQHSLNITFSKLAQAFLVIPPHARAAKVDFREITKDRSEDLKEKYAELLETEWVTGAGIDSFISKKDPIALLLIASELYKLRYRFNKYNYNQHEFIELLQLLTGFEIAVQNEKKELTWHVDKEFYPAAALNLLVYFAGNYSKFSWDNQNSIFSNAEIEIKPLTREDYLFQQLNSETDSIAVAAYIELSIGDPQKVAALAEEYEKAGIDKNFALPIFPYRFLKQQAALSTYCRTNGIDFLGTSQIRTAIVALESDLQFAKRRRLEDSLINNLTLDQITALEYWTLIKEESWNLTYSAGRILDIFYSKNWDMLLNSDAHLKLYLKKSLLFDRLGIIGVCNNYLQKFINNGAKVSAILAALKTEDNDIKEQIKTAIANCLVLLKRPKDSLKINDGNRDFKVKDLAEQIKRIKTRETDQEKMEDKLVELLSKITYSQIGTALREIEYIPFLENPFNKKYSFMKTDWGFLMEESFDSLTSKDFLKLYDSLSEYALYAHYLDKAGIIYKNPDGSLDYDRIFEILKYNVVTAFVGGGGGKQGNEVYSIIKLLELTHHTTLGYPKKLCNSNDLYACYADDRANHWMQFLIDKKLLKASHSEPVSFNYK
jgi:hypothetical protein